jgi:hypothetical protein
MTQIRTAHTKGNHLFRTHRQETTRNAGRNTEQRNGNVIIDTGAQVTTMPDAQSPRRTIIATSPGTAVKYSNGEIETIERFVDIGHYEVQITPTNAPPA